MARSGGGTEHAQACHPERQAQRRFTQSGSDQGGSERIDSGLHESLTGRGQTALLGKHVQRHQRQAGDCQ